jgi:cardiolipin synthase A/B
MLSFQTWIANLWAVLPSAPVFWLSVAVVLAVLSLVQTVWVIMQRRSPVSTLGWIVTVTLLPVVGLVMYRFLGPMRVQRQRLKRMHGVAALSSQKERLALREEQAEPPRWVRQHSRLIERACGLPLSSVRDITRIIDGAATLKAMLEAIGAARDHIHLEYYIYEPDRVGTPLRDALVAKLREGVKVRLLVDAVGSPLLVKKTGAPFLREFLQLGGEFAVFHPTRFAKLRPLVNLRTHRKILICDGVVGFTGGVNITEAENEALHADAFRDTHLRLEGPAVRWLQYVFLEDWAYANGEGKALRLSPDLIVQSPPGVTAVQIMCSGPDTHGEAIHRAVIDALHQSRRRIWLTTPYFVPTEPTLYALTDAAMRGVDVKILVPKLNDSRLVAAAAQSYYEELQAAGVKIFEYQPRMLHAKTLVVDDGYTAIGTANFDHRSFRLNFEVAVVVFDEALNVQLADDFERDLRDSKLVALNRKQPFATRLSHDVARLFSPVL